MKQGSAPVTLEASVRSEKGKGEMPSIRQQGWVPGVVYKEGSTSVPVKVMERELLRALHTKAGGNALITLRLEGDSRGGEPAPPRPRSLPRAGSSGEGDRGPRSGSGATENKVLIKELQRHPVTHRILHVDFHQVSLSKRITVSVPLRFQSEAIGVRQQGGVLEHLRWELEVECLPTEIPSEIWVDVAGLELGKALHVQDLTLPPGVRAVTAADQPVVACVEPKKEEIPAAAPAGGAEAAEPEVIKQKKPEEEAPAEAPAAAKEKAPPPKEKEGKPKP